MKAETKKNWLGHVAFTVLVLLGLLDFGLIRSNLPILNAIGPQGIAGPQGPKGDTPVIDYARINTAIGKQIAEIPTPKNGVNGKDAKPCTTKTVPGGSQITCPNGTISFVANGTQGEQGTAGDPGTPAKVRLERCVQNGLNPREEYQYEGDFTWQVDYYLPIGSICP